MSLISKLSIHQRLLLGFGIVILGTLVAASMGVVSLWQMKARINVVSSELFARAEALAKLERALAQRDIALRDLAGQDDPTAVIAEIKKFRVARDEYKTIRDELIKQLADDQGSVETAKKIDALNTDMQKVVEAVLNHAMTGNPTEAMKTVREQMTPLRTQMNAQLSALHQSVNQYADSIRASANTWAQSVIVGLVAISVAFLSIGAFVSWLIGKSVVRPIHTAVGVMNEIARGDLTRDVPSNNTAGRDETSQMMRALSEMQLHLRDLVSRVRTSTQEITVASAEVATGNQDLSARTEQQAASLQQTSASMSHMTSAIRDTSEKAREADQLASNASTIAARGGEVVGEVVSTMAGISQSSKKIADIIGVIDGIAFQTNILALNAAVEAARAGEQGRGFAVVASEVRSLAQRSANAAKEIKSLIAESVERVEAGSAHVDRAGKTMDEIVSAITRVTTLIADISATSNTQTSEIDQITTAVARMDDMTQQNAALVEESAAAATSMRQQAQTLDAMVGQFKLSAV
jgi:methyl-accepting chemotaxis protein